MKMQANPSFFFFINLILVNLPSLTLVLFFFFLPHVPPRFVQG